MYALALETAKGLPKREWDRLTKAAIRYAQESKRATMEEA
jgi:hypothetical protein